MMSVRHLDTCTCARYVAMDISNPINVSNHITSAKSKKLRGLLYLEFRTIIYGNNLWSSFFSCLRQVFGLKTRFVDCVISRICPLAQPTRLLLSPPQFTGIDNLQYSHIFGEHNMKFLTVLATNFSPTLL